MFVVRIVLLLSFCVLIAPPVTAQPENPGVHITVAAVTPEPRPSDHVSKAARPENYDKATEFLSKCNIRVSYVDAPSWARAFEMAATGYVDGLIATNKTPDRHSLFYFPTKPYTSVMVLAFVRKGHTATHFTSWGMFDGKTLGHIRGSRLSKDFDKYVATPQATVRTSTTLESLFEALMVKKIDFAIGQLSLEAAFKGPLGSRRAIRALIGPVGETPLYVAISKKGKFAADTTHPAFRCLMD